jgi:hypothetical protein
MSNLTYPYLVEFYNRAQEHLSPATLEWVRARARSAAGGRAYPANSPLQEDTVVESVTDANLYKQVYNACVQWAGKELADRVARSVMPPEVIVEEDLQGLSDEDGALFLWTMMHPRLIEVYGTDGKQPPDYVPENKRGAWIALWNAIYKKTGDESKAFAVANSKFVEGK